MVEQTPFEKRFPARMYPKLLSRVPDTPGIYLISNFMESPPHNARGRDRILRKIKVGKAQKSLRRRLSSYLLYWPTGVVVYALIGTKTFAQASWLEVFLHNFLRLCGTRYRRLGKQNQKLKHSHLSEWFMLDEVLTRNLLSTFFTGGGSNHIRAVSRMLSTTPPQPPSPRTRARLESKFPMLALYEEDAIQFTATTATQQSLAKLVKPATLKRITESWTVHVREPRLLKTMLLAPSIGSRLQIRPLGSTAATETFINRTLQKALLDQDRGWRHAVKKKPSRRRKLSLQ